ncbi:MoaD/ThiS family protein [Litorivivens sp.]|uniref:MoaD/ThiS family protein n=1 Tax=Litorivivens sp. TaxID=2020868 RepID=UPI003564921A
MIKVLFFAKLRESLGCGSLEWPVQEPLSLKDLRDQIIARHPEWEPDLCAQNVIAAVNQAVAAPHEVVQPGDEVAFYPPVTGG